MNELAYSAIHSDNSIDPFELSRTVTYHANSLNVDRIVYAKSLQS